MNTPCTCATGVQCDAYRTLKRQSIAAWDAYSRRGDTAQYDRWRDLQQAMMEHMRQSVQERLFSSGVDEWGREHIIPKERQP